MLLHGDTLKEKGEGEAVRYNRTPHHRVQVHIFAKESNFLSHEAIMNNHLYNKSSLVHSLPSLSRLPHLPTVPVDDEKRHQQISMTKHKKGENIGESFLFFRAKASIGSHYPASFTYTHSLSFSSPRRPSSMLYVLDRNYPLLHFLPCLVLLLLSLSPAICCVMTRV